MKKLIALLVVVLVVGGGVTYLYYPRGASLSAAVAATLAVLSTDISAQHGSGDFQPALDGDLLANGDVVKSSVDGRAVLTFFDASTLTVETGAIVKVTTLNTLSNGGIQAAIEQTLGRTWAAVTKLKTPDSKFEIKTPTSTAVVRGTAFETLVERRPDGTTVVTYKVDDGQVLVTADAGGSVLVTPNTQVTIAQGQPAPAAPTPIPPGPVLRLTASSGIGFAATSPLGATCGSAGNRAEIPGCLVSGNVATVRDPAPGRYLVLLTAAAAAPNATLRAEALFGTTVQSTQTFTRTFALGDLVRTAFVLNVSQQSTVSPFEPAELVTSVCGAEATGRVFSGGTVQERDSALQAFSSASKGAPVSLVLTDAEIVQSVRGSIEAAGANAPVNVRDLSIQTDGAGIHVAGNVATPVGTIAAKGDVVAGPLNGRLALRLRNVSAGPLPAALIEQIQRAAERSMNEFSASFPMIVRRVALRPGCIAIMGSTP